MLAAEPINNINNNYKFPVRRLGVHRDHLVSNSKVKNALFIPPSCLSLHLTVSPSPSPSLPLSVSLFRLSLSLSVSYLVPAQGAVRPAYDLHHMPKLRPVPCLKTRQGGAWVLVALPHLSMKPIPRLVWGNV